MKPPEQLVAAIRELRFAIDRLTGDELGEMQPAARQALIAQAQALEADLETLRRTLAEDIAADAREGELAG
jgi:hypothetical protein